MIEHLLQRHALISDQVEKTELRVILRELVRTLQQQTPGSIVEMGCYMGTTSLFIQRVLKETGASREFHVYDSFAGLPPKKSQDLSPSGEQFKSGELNASKTQFVKNFKQAGLPLPVIHKGWFSDIQPNNIPETIAFAFLDGDFYESIRDSLWLITPKLVPGSVIVVDDYQAEALPGAAKAVDEWLKGKPHALRVESSLAIIHIKETL